MIAMLNETYPISAAIEVAKIFIEELKTNPHPDYMQMLGLYAHWGGDGIVVYAYYQIEDGKVDEGVKDLTSRELKFASVDGYKVQFQVVLPVAEALALVGMEMP
jgi:hypothetical protein